MTNKQHAYLIGIWTISTFALAIISDIIEIALHGFGDFQILITYISFLGIPYSVIGLYALYQEKGGVTLLTGSLCFGLSYVFFAGTALFVMVERTADYLKMVKQLGFIYELHGLLLIIGAVLMGWVIIRQQLARSWIGVLLILGAVVTLIGALLPSREITYTLGNALRYIGLIGLGFDALQRSTDWDTQS